MSQIGIAIKPTISGNHHPIAINEGDWTRHIRDVRPALLHYPAMQKDHRLIASMFFFVEKGCYIVICRTVTNNDLENVSGWIHIPYNMQISTAELEEVIHLMRQIVEQPVLPHRQYLQQIFGAKQYPDKHDAQLFEPSPRIAIFAKRVLGRNQSLATLLGENFFLPSYANYETILVEEFPGEVTDADDITQVCNNEQSQIEAEIRRRARVAYSHRYRRVEYNERTQVFGQEEKTKIFGEGERTMPMNFTPGQLGTTDQRDRQRPIDESTTPSITPVNPTYGVSENPKNFFQKHGRGIIIGLLAGILLSLLVCGILALCGSFDSHKGNYTAGNVEGDVFSVAGDSPDFTSLKAAIAYLDGTQNWDRSNMENYTQLQGLYDDLNDFNLTKIINTWSNKLSDSKNFQRLVTAAYECKNANVSGKFRSAGEPINVQEYIDRLSSGAKANSTPVETYQPSTPKVSTGSHKSPKPTPRPNPLKPAPKLNMIDPLPLHSYF